MLEKTVVLKKLKLKYYMPTAKGIGKICLTTSEIKMLLGKLYVHVYSFECDDLSSIFSSFIRHPHLSLQTDNLEIAAIYNAISLLYPLLGLYCTLQQ